MGLNNGNVKKKQELHSQCPCSCSCLVKNAYSTNKDNYRKEAKRAIEES